MELSQGNYSLAECTFIQSNFNFFFLMHTPACTRLPPSTLYFKLICYTLAPVGDIGKPVADTGETRARGAWLFWGEWAEEEEGRTLLRGKAQQLRGSDAEQKKSESSTSHKTLSSGIVYRADGNNSTLLHPARTTLSHTCRQKGAPSLPHARPSPHPCPQTHVPNFYYLPCYLKPVP